MTEHGCQQTNENVINDTTDLNDSKDSTLFGVYSVKDLKLDSFTPPFIAKTDSEAIRQFANIVNYSNSLMNRFPEDYQLYRLGVFFSNTGYLSVLAVPILIVEAKKCVKEDSIKYDELVKQTQTLQFQVQNICKEFDDKAALYDKKLRELSYLEDTLKTKYANKDSVDVYPCIPEKAKKLSLKKRTFLDKLFGE